MYDSCPERIVCYGISAQSKVRLIIVVSIRWHRVRACQSLVLASHTQRVNVRLRDNARRLCPRTALSEQYMFPFASHSQSVWSLQHVRRILVLACFKQRVHDLSAWQCQATVSFESNAKAIRVPIVFPFSASIATASMSEAYIDRV